MRRYAIVGTGVAGISAAGALRRVDPAAEIALVGDDPHGFYSRPGLAYFLTDEVPELQLYIYSSKDWHSLDLRLVKQRATRILPDEHQLELQGGNRLAYDRLLLATGATAMRLQIPGTDLQGVVKLDDFEDALRIRKIARRGKTAVVVGGGIVAMELVEGLVARGVKVHYLLRGDRYWSNVLDPIESRIVEQHLMRHGVQPHYQTEAAEILGQSGKVSGVCTTKGEVIRCAIVAVGIGIRTRLELAQAAGLKTERGILTDETLQTSDPDIFAAGDVAQVFDARTGQSTLDSLWNPARRQGEAAAANMTGQRRPFCKPPVVNIARLAGLLTTIIGGVGGGRDEDVVSIARGSSETWQALPNAVMLESGQEINHMRLVLGERTVLGAVVMGDQALSIPLQELVSAQTDITSIRAELTRAEAPVGRILTDFWEQWMRRDPRA